MRWAAQRRARGVVRHEGQLVERRPSAAHASGGAPSRGERARRRETHWTVVDCIATAAGVGGGVGRGVFIHLQLTPGPGLPPPQVHLQSAAPAGSGQANAFVDGQTELAGADRQHSPVYWEKGSGGRWPASWFESRNLARRARMDGRGGGEGGEDGSTCA